MATRATLAAFFLSQIALLAFVGGGNRSNMTFTLDGEFGDDLLVEDQHEIKLAGSGPISWNLTDPNEVDLQFVSANPGTLTIASTPGSTCGAGEAGSMGIINFGGPMWYCDASGTPATRYAAYGNVQGDAHGGVGVLTGDVDSRINFSAVPVALAKGMQISKAATCVHNFTSEATICYGQNADELCLNDGSGFDCLDFDATYQMGAEDDTAETNAKVSDDLTHATGSIDLETVTLTGAVDHDALICNGAGACIWVSLPDCHTENALTYNRSTHTIGCETDDGGGGGMTSFDLTDTDASPVLTVNQGEEIQLIGSTGIVVECAADGSDHDCTFTGHAIFAPAADPNANHSGFYPEVLDAYADACGDTAALLGDAAHSCLVPAPLASPALTGDPTTPTPATDDSDTSIASTAFVQGELGEIAGSCTNQVVTAVNADAVPTCAGVSSAMIDPNTIVAADVAASLDTRKGFHVVIADPDPAAANYVLRLPPFAGTLTRIDCEAYGGTNVVINVCDGEDYLDDSCTTSIPNGTMTCDTTGASEATLQATGFAIRDKVSLVLVSESGSVDRLEVYATVTVD